MTREDIEKASKDYQNTLPYCDDRKVRGYFVGAKDGFIKGAEWRINSVWHSNDTVPACDCKVLIEDVYGNVYDDRYDADYDEYESGTEKNDIKRWVYVKDLIPTNE